MQPIALTVSLPPGGTLTVAASRATGDDAFTPGCRYHRDEDGGLWRTPIGWQGEPLSEPVRIEESPHA